MKGPPASNVQPRPGIVPAGLSRLRMLGRIAGQNYRRSQITRMAAALSFRTIFGLIPVLVVALVVLHTFVTAEQRLKVVSEMLQFSGLAQISIDSVDEPAAQAREHASAVNLFGTPAASLQSSLAQAAQSKAKSKARKARLDEWIVQLLERVDSINFNAIGIVGVALLIYAALSMIVEIEKAFNQIAGAPAGKSWIRRVTQYWALLTLGPLLLMASFAVHQGARDVADRWTGTPAQVAEAPPAQADVAADPADPATPPAEPDRPRFSFRAAVVETVGFLTTVLISTLALLIIFTSVPNTRMKILASAAGALFAALLWETSKWGFTSYLAYSATYSRLYGVLALLPLFLLWVYVTWIIVLLGFQIATILQAYHHVSGKGFQRSVLEALGLTGDDKPMQAGGVRLVDPAAVLVVLCEVAGRFRRGLLTDATHVARATGIDEAISAQLLESLVGSSMLHRVAGGEGEGAYTLARPADEIEAKDVVALGELLGATAHGTPSPLLDAINKAKLRAFEGKTLANVEAMTIDPAAAIPAGPSIPA